MNGDGKRVIIVPCSGIGKPFGSVSREAAYELCESLRPDATQLAALSKLVLGDPAARATVARCPAMTIDGCKRMCAATMVRRTGGTVVREATVFDFYREHRNLKPDGIAELNEAGLKLARLLAEDLAGTVDEMIRADAERGGRHG